MRPFNLEAFRNGEIAVHKDGNEVRYVQEITYGDGSKSLIFNSEYANYAIRYVNSKEYKEYLVGMRHKKIKKFLYVYKASGVWKLDACYYTLGEARQVYIGVEFECIVRSAKEVVE
jgi:hypothetical protein